MSKGYSQARRLYGFLIISGITLGLVLVASSDSQTWTALKLLGLKELVLLVFLSALMLSMDALRVMILSKALGHRIPFGYALKMILVGRFFGAITPLQSGMMPAEMYMMYSHGVPLGKAISVDVIKRITTMGMLAFGGIAVMLLNKDFAGNTLLLYVYYYVIAFFVFLTLLFFFVYFFPNQTLWIVDRVMEFLHRRGVVVNYEIDEYVKSVAHDYFNAVDFYTHRGLPHFMMAMIVTFIFVAVQFVLAPIIIHGLGYPVKLMDAIQAQVILLPMLYYSPTPGGSGIAEGGFALLFVGLIPKHLVGISVVLWRIFSTYLYVGLGAVLTLGSMDIEKVLGFMSRSKPE